MDASERSGQAPLAVEFRFQLESRSGGRIVRAEFDPGDGSAKIDLRVGSGFFETRRHLYRRPGLFRASLTLAPESGAPMTVHRVVRVAPERPADPNELLKAAPIEGVAPFEAQFAVGGTTLPFVANTARLDFGDGTSRRVSPLSTVPHTYEKPGRYTATLEIQGAHRNRARARVEIDVQPKPRLKFVVAPRAGTAPMEVTVRAAIAGPIREAQIKLDGETWQTQGGIHRKVFDEAGKHTFELVAVALDGQVVRREAQIEVMKHDLAGYYRHNGGVVEVVAQTGAFEGRLRAPSVAQAQAGYEIGETIVKGRFSDAARTFSVSADGDRKRLYYVDEARQLYEGEYLVRKSPACPPQWADYGYRIAFGDRATISGSAHHSEWEALYEQVYRRMGRPPPRRGIVGRVQDVADEISRAMRAQGVSGKPQECVVSSDQPATTDAVFTRMTEAEALEVGRQNLRGVQDFADSAADINYRPPFTRDFYSTEDRVVTSDDPVILNSGDFFESEIDLAVPGRGLDWSFQRTYRSQSRVRTSMGFGWVHNAMQALAVDGDTAQFRTATGARLWLKKTSDGLFQSESGVRLRVTDAERVVRDVDGTLYTFRPAPAAPTQSYLVSIEDARGNRLRFTTDLFGRVVAVADSLGRMAHYRYDAATGLLAEVAAPDGRRVAFRYDGHGDLVRVSRFAPSADAPYSETAYAYSSGQQQPDLNHNLTHIWLPGDIGANQPSVEIRYGADPGTDTFDRVVWQRSGAVVETFSYRTVDAPAGRLFETRVAAEGRATSVHAFADGAREVRRHLEAADGTRIGIENEYDPKGRLVRETSPEGNGVLYRRDSEGRTVEVHEVPRPGSPLPPRVFVYRYEPLYGRLKAAYGPFAGSAPTDPRELERRLIVRNDFDYEEATALPPSLAAFGVDVKPAGLGDLNGDGRADGAAGLVVRSTRPAEPGAMGGGSAALETRYVYREGGLPLRATGPDGSVREFEYRAAGTERAGYLHRVSVRHADGVRREIARYDWDEFGRLVGVTDRDGRRVGIVNDSLGRAIMIVPADPGLPRQRLAYDPQGRIVGEWRLTEDERRSGKPGAPVAEYRFDAFGKMLSYRLWADGGAPIERQYVHDRGGRLAAIVAGNRRWERTLDPFGRTVREGIPGAGGFARTFAYDRNGNVTADTDGDGNRSEYRYDGFDRLAEIVRPDGSSVKFGLDLADRMVERRILGRARDGAPSAALRIDGVDYPDDARGQATALWVGSERDGKLVKRIVARATYDRFGRATGMTLLDRPTPVELTVRRDAAGAVASIDDASGPLVGLLRDRLGRPATLQLASAAGATQPLALLSRDYHEGADGVVLPGGGRIVESTIAEPGAGRIERRALDAGGREAARTTVALDRIGRPIRVTSQRPHVADRPVTVLDRVLRWDEFSRLAEVKDGNGTLARLEYDASGRLASWSHFGLDPRRRTYAEHGSDSTVDALGNRTETRRDGMGRIVAMSHFGRDATTPEIERRFEFDGLGRLAGHSNAAWQVERRFADDGAAREDLHADRQDGRRFAVASRFDPYGRLSSYRYPSGLEVSYEWRTENEVRIRTAGIELTVRYDDAGRIAGVATDRAEVRYERSAPNPGIELRATRVLAAGREALVQADRFRDGVLESRRAEPGGLDSRYRRDPQGRLIAGSSFVADGAAAPRPVEFRYGFDGRGNRAFETLGAETTAYEARAGYGPARVGADAVRYDAAGAVVAIGAETYTHDASGRLAAYRDAARGIELRYRRDAEGRVVRREAPGDVRVYVHGDAGLLAEYRNEAVRAEYVYDGSGQLLAVVTEGKAALAATGPDGSLLALIDPDGAIRERHYHGAYGATSVRDAAGRPVDSPRSALSFAGMMYDAAARLYVTPTRTLAPRIGGFLSPEPLGPFAADHPYAYAMDDPLSFTDRSGLQADAVTGGTDANVGLARQAVKPVTDLYERSTGALNQAFGEEKPRESGSGGGAPASPSGTSPGLSHERSALPASRDYAAEARRDEAARRSAELRAREAAEQKRSARNRAYARTVLPDTVVANWLDERNWHRLRYPRDYRPRPGESPWHPFHGPSAVDPPGVPSDLLRQGLANSPVARDPERELRQILDRYLAGRPANLAVPTPGQGGTTTDAAASTQMPGEGGGRPPPQTQQPGGAAGVFGQFGQDIQTSLTPGDNPGQNSVGVTVQGSGGPEAELHRPGAEAGKVRPAPPPRGLLRLGL